MNQKSRFSRLAVCSVALAMAVGCGAAAPADTGDGPAAPDRVTVSVVGNYITAYAPFWAGAPELAAIEERYATEIAYSSFGRGGDALTAVVGGGADVCICNFAQGLRGAVQDQPISYVSNFFIGPGTALIGAAAHEADRGTDLRAYDGGTFGYTQEGGASHLTLVATVEDRGMNWADQNGIAVGSITALVPALQSGRVDAAVMDVASAATSIRDGHGYLIHNSNDLPSSEAATGRILGNGLVMGREFRETYPELAQDLVDATIAGLDRVRAETDASVVHGLMPPEFQEAHPDPEAFAAEWELMQPAFLPTDGSTEPDALRDTTRDEFSAEDIAGPGAQSYIDNSLVDAAYSRLGIPRPSSS
ncbi:MULTISPECIES: ABC transporter substrate-binding protein [Pseudonocardia]|uniref:ABC transporter substrate-binding protein n=1 Tax=Pseudonocardia TaxID=1847 RepID=UPI0010E08691|nr:MULTISPECIES: ABC transporter substrate-binding protein [Pseudonocardia]TDN71912.1 ABC-type nitrate/sulfonate/bicarbonate transport system substrate-binding protein [Pseudonocardia autotrophica]